MEIYENMREMQAIFQWPEEKDTRSCEGKARRGNWRTGVEGVKYKDRMQKKRRRRRRQRSKREVRS